MFSTGGAMPKNHLSWCFTCAIFFILCLHNIQPLCFPACEGLAKGNDKGRVQHQHDIPLLKAIQFMLSSSNVFVESEGCRVVMMVFLHKYHFVNLQPKTKGFTSRILSLKIAPVGQISGVRPCASTGTKGGSMTPIKQR